MDHSESSAPLRLAEGLRRSSMIDRIDFGDIHRDQGVQRVSSFLCGCLWVCLWACLCVCACVCTWRSRRFLFLFLSGFALFIASEQKCVMACLDACAFVYHSTRIGDVGIVGREGKGGGAEGAEGRGRWLRGAWPTFRGDKTETAEVGGGGGGGGGQTTATTTPTVRTREQKKQSKNEIFFCFLVCVCVCCSFLVFVLFFFSRR